MLRHMVLDSKEQGCFADWTGPSRRLENRTETGDKIGQRSTTAAGASAIRVHLELGIHGTESYPMLCTRSIAVAPHFMFVEPPLLRSAKVSPVPQTPPSCVATL